MPQTAVPERYRAASIGLHWLMFVLMAAAYAAIELHERFPRGTGVRETLETGHFVLGLSVFVAVWLRIAARLAWRAPAPIEQGWRHAASVVTHGLLYVLMIAMPHGLDPDER